MYSAPPSCGYRLRPSVPVRLFARALTLGICVLIVSCIACMAYAFETGDVSCEQYVQTFDSEMGARSRSGHEKDGLYSFYKVFLSYAEGFFRGTDSMSLGSQQDQDEHSAMLWLRNYCDDNPLDSYATALQKLRAVRRAKSN